MAEHRFPSASEIIALAIRREVEAAEGYERMAGLARTPGARELLEALRKDEINHRRLLEGLAPEKLGALTPAAVSDLELVDGLGDEELRADATLQELFIFAAKKEKAAAEFYAGLARTAEDEDTRRLLEFLAGQERQHKLKLEDEYEKAVLPEN